MLNLKKYRKKEQGLADLLNYAAVIEDGIVLLKSGALMASWEYIGSDSATLTYDEINMRSSQINNVLLQFGEGWMIQHDCSRLKSVSYPKESECFFDDSITAVMDEERREFFSSGRHYENTMVVTLTYLPPMVTETKFLDLMVDGAESIDILGVGEQNLDVFRSKIIEFEGSVGDIFNMTRLHGHVEEVDIHGNIEIKDEQLRYINHCITGDNHPINLPPIPMFLDCIIPGQEIFTGLRPLVGDKYLGAVCIDGFPSSSYPGILEGLTQYQCEYRWNNRFIFENPEKAKKTLNRFRLKWQQKKRGFVAQLTKNYNSPVDRFAEEMEMQTEQSMSEVSSGAVMYGYYSSTVVVMDKDPDQLQEILNVFKNHIVNLGFSARIESINTMEAYLGSLPGHAVENLRRPVVHTLNLADFLPVTSVWAGQEYCPCPFYPANSPPLIVSSTAGNTPFRLNLHVSDIGHTLILGPTGSGKSTLVGLIAAQFNKYPQSTVFCFDIGRSMYPLAAAIPGAIFYDIGEDESVEFCPLLHLETDTDQAWAEEWIVSMLRLQGIEVLPKKRNAVKTALYQHRQSADKSLHDFVVNLQDQELSQALERYTVNSVQSSAILDAEEDNLKLSSFNVFELSSLMEMGEDMILPVLTYLFHRVEHSLNGQPAIIILEEAWLLLGHKLFKNKIRTWLKTLRKSNCAIILATQSISDAANSGILDVIDESCPTKIFLANPMARDEENAKLYKSLGMNTREIDLLSKITPKKDYYYRSPIGRRLFDLNLGKIALSLVGSSGKEDLQKIMDLQKEYGTEWVKYWFNYKGVIS